MKTTKSVSELKVAEVMTKRVETLTPIDTVKHAVQLLQDSRLTTVPVVDVNNKCIGILSRSDLMEMFMQEDDALSLSLESTGLSQALLNRALDTGDVRQVRELMTHDVTTVKSEQSIPEACREMTKLQVHHLPVVDEQELVVGIISTFDIVRAVADA